MNKKRIILLSIIGLIVCVGCIFAWDKLVSTTKIAFVNYQAVELGQIAKANRENSFIKISELTPEEFDKAKNYDMIFVNGMGLRITDKQRQMLTEAADKGTPVMSTAVTNPQNQINSVDSVDVEYLKQYLDGGRSNYRNMLRYVRRFIDGKKIFAPVPGDPVLSGGSLIYYPTDKDELAFMSVSEYEQWLKENGKWKASAPHIILTGQMGVADSLVSHLERSGNIVYPIRLLQPAIAGGAADSVQAAAVINMAHGRLGDEAVKWFENKNIPLFSTVNANRDYNEWIKDKMGMNGGFLSQSIVTPEIDGAMRPYTLFAQYKGPDGLPTVEVIPDRLIDFVGTVNNYIKLRQMSNSTKKVAIFYFKGPGQNALVAEGMEVAPSLFNLLKRLESEGYNVGKLPLSAAELEKLIAEKGKIFNNYAIGAASKFVAEANPQIVSKADYDKWCKASFSDAMLKSVDKVDGKFPGHGLTDGKGGLAIARLQFGNVVLIPQTAAGLGDDDFKIVHGTDVAPPHAYIASYLWARHGFGADALIHFGAHGSLEFTPRKQVALSSNDWSDRLVGPMPHLYVYSTSNVGEAMIAKRRSYAGIVNYLTPPFMESNVRGVYKNLTDALDLYNISSSKRDSIARAANVKQYAVSLGIHRELRIDSLKPFADSDIKRIEAYADELVNEKMIGAHYVLGRPYEDKYIKTTVEAMTIDPIAYSLQKLRGGDIKHWRNEAKRLVASNLTIDDALLCGIAGITPALLDSARRTNSAIEGSKGMFSRMMVMGAMMPRAQRTPLKIADRKAPRAKHSMIPGMSPETALAMARKMGADEVAIKKMEAAMKRKSSGGKGMGSAKGMSMTSEGFSPKAVEFATSVAELEKALKNVSIYRTALVQSPENELKSILNGLNGGFISPTSGGDPVLNPNILPTGRNMFAVNAEETPSAQAWEKGKELADGTIAMYRRAHGDSIPRKVSYTLWSSEFIETEGATIAQILYMLGVEPVRDPFGRVTDLRLIPSEALGRPRIDVVVQTSGQLRDLAASRLFLIGRAVKMAAATKGDKYPNYVAEGVLESEKHLVEKGVSPKEAREMATSRVYGGVNGNYGSGIQAMVEAGDRWDDRMEIAKTYIQNMGASYDSEEAWEAMRDFAFEAALTRTDVVVQPRQSNTWGALSLDHVYEFMGGMNLAVRSVTGKEPDAYLSDYRNRNRVRMQEVKEAIGVESRTTILNPEYIKEKMRGGAGDASAIAEVINNTYGWDVMKSEVIDEELWNDIYDTYVADKHKLGVKEYFRNVNPAALQEMTAVMLETARKGMWKASPEQLKNIAKLHTETVRDFGAACSGFVCDNAKLRDFIAKNVDSQSAKAYNAFIAAVRAENIADADNGMVMKRETLNEQKTDTSRINGIIIAAVVFTVLFGIGILIYRRRKSVKK